MTVERKRGLTPQSIIGRFMQRRREARAARQLLQLSDRLLRDIGLTRFDVVAAVTSSGGSSPSRILSTAASENRLMMPANDASSSVAATESLAA